MIAKLALLLAAAAGAAPDLGKLAGLVRAAVGAVTTLTVVETDPTGQRRWAAWQEGVGDGQATYLALFATGNGGVTPVWSMRWPNGYEPRLRTLTEWSYRDGSIAAITVQFGAGAVEVDLFGLGADGQPRPLGKYEAAAAEWRGDAKGVPVLVLHDRQATALKTRCLAWRAATAVLAPVRCPA